MAFATWFISFVVCASKVDFVNRFTHYYNIVVEMNEAILCFFNIYYNMFSSRLCNKFQWEWKKIFKQR